MPHRWLNRLFGRIASAAPLPDEAEASPTAPLNVTLIAPFVEGQSWCDEARFNPDILDDEDANAFCTALGRSGAPGIAATLDELGPAISPSGRFELGYTLVLPLLRFFMRVKDGWAVDLRAVDVALSTIGDVDRPVVLHLSATHFNFEGRELAAELGEDARNLMWTQKGPLNSHAYFNTPVFAWTLVDDDAPINRYRREAFAAVLNQVARLPDTVRARIRAVSFLGETHQLFPDLQGAGAGYGSPFDITDYSPAAQRGFHRWLQGRFTTLAALNQALDATYAAFEDVVPPGEDLKGQAEPNRLRHLDEHAAGNLPIIGWAARSGGPPLQVDIYLDGTFIASTTSDLNRLDVLEARPEFNTPNVGFRYDLDYRSLGPGRHTLAIFARISEGHLYRLAEREFVVRSVGLQVAAVAVGKLPIARSIDKDVIGYIDRPTPEIELFYNPLARLWMEYREEQVLRFQEQFARIARREGVEEKLTFSHQIIPELYPDYNPEKISVGMSLNNNTMYNPGVSIYGGCAFGDQFFRVKERLDWVAYAVTEFNPLTALSPLAYMEMFHKHNSAGAVFIAPYYLSNKVQIAHSQLTKRLASPDNPEQGSREFYHAISRLMREA